MGGWVGGRGRVGGREREKGRHEEEKAIKAERKEGSISTLHKYVSPHTVPCGVIVSSMNELVGLFTEGANPVIMGGGSALKLIMFL